MKKKVHKVGTIKDSDLKKKIRKPICRPGFPMKSKKDYKRNKKINDNE